MTASHKTASFELLERLSRTPDDVASTLVELAPCVQGAVVLATCNRFEAYVEMDEPVTAAVALGVDGAVAAPRTAPAPDPVPALDVQGLGGATPVNAAGCEVVRDRCEALPEAQRCGSWQQRFRDARGRERFAAPENRDTARGERERLQGVLEASNCPVPG